MYGLNRSGTNLAHVCAYFVAHIFCYHSILFWRRRDLAWSNQILNPKFRFWGWHLCSSVLFVVLFVLLIYLAGNNLRSFLPWQLQITRSRDTEPYLYMDRISPFSVAATMLSTPDIWYILGSNSSRMSFQSIILWGSLRVAAYTRFLWSENMFISQPKIIPRNCLRHSTIARSSFYVLV